MAESRALFNAARAYAMVAMHELAEKCPATEPKVISGLRHWCREAEGFYLRDRIEPYWIPCLRTYASSLRSLPEYQELLAALHGDREIAPQLGQLVWIGNMSAQMLTEDRVTDGLLYCLAELQGNLGFDERAFAEAFERLDLSLRQSEYEMKIIAPIAGLRLDDSSIALSQDLELARLDDNEVLRCLEANLLPSPRVMYGLAPIIPLCGVRVRYTLAKRVGAEPVSTDRQREIDDLSAMTRPAYELLHALRVFRSGKVMSLGHVAFCDTFFGSLAYIRPESSRLHVKALFSNEYTLTQQEGREFAAFWGDLHTARRNGFIENAIRRFGYAGDRDLPDDRLVDLMIAAESLFLYEIDDQDRGELTYRLSQRAAFFISEAPGPSRHDVFRLMRNAYRVRSAIVHGGVPGNDLLRTPERGSVSMPEFVESVELHLRGALRKMIQLLRQPGARPPDWNRLTFE